MEKYSINIANDYSKTPGGRWKDLGPFSGEQFYEEMLLPRFDEAVASGEKLHTRFSTSRLESLEESAGNRKLKNTSFFIPP